MRSNCILTLILLLTLFCSKINGQKQEELSFTLDWLTEDSKKVTPYSETYFKSEQFTDEGEPYFNITKELEGRPDKIEVQLFNKRSSAFSIEKRNSFDFSDDYRVESSVKYGRNQAYAVINVYPIRETSESGMERLESFQMSIRSKGVRKKPSKSRAAGNSVLAEGSWYKIRIESDGIYRMDRSFFIDNGVDLTNVSPQQINVYGNTGDQLPFENNVFRYDDLVVNPIEFVGDEDSSFENGEYFIFYGDDSNSWEFQEGENQMNFFPSVHNYSDYAYYFVRIDDEFSNRIQNENLPTGNAEYISNSFDEFTFHEIESVNMVKSGRRWFGENFNLTTELLLNFNFPNILPETGYINIETAARSLGGDSFFNISLNSGESASLEMDEVGTGPVSPVVNIEGTSFGFSPNSETVGVTIEFDKYSSDSEGWLDFVALQCRRSLQMTGNVMDFRDSRAIGAGVTRYELSGIGNSNGLKVWNITDGANYSNVPYELNDGLLDFNFQSDELENFIVFNNSSFQIPEWQGAVANQNLHSFEDVDMVILSNPLFLAAADELAEIHRGEGMEVIVVTPQQVFNEFSSGNPDVTGIKMFMKMLYDNAEGDPDLAPQYLCILGDGTYRNREISSESPYVITYHSKNSDSPIASYVTDDYYVLLDDDEGELVEDKLDAGVGRVLARTEEEALQMVDKVRLYLSQNSTSDGGANCLGADDGSTFGSWRNRLVFVSDDQDGNGIEGVIHMNNSEELINIIQSQNREFNFTKIYADAYEQTSTPGGERYDAAKEEIKRSVQDGALVVNYVGHGGEKGWAHERILDIPTIRNWSNRNMPIFVTATCELTRFDDPEFLSAGELTFLNPDGGAIAMLTTTRIVFSGSNQALASSFYHHFFGVDSTPSLRIGEVYMKTKNSVSSVNQENFTLIGDPAITIQHPKKEVFTTAINGIDISSFNDTLKALETVTISGYVGDELGGVLEDFNGFVYPSVYDKEQKVFSLANDGETTPYEFDVRRNVLYNGKASVENGQFSYSFVIPKDINFQVGNGKISYYGVEGSLDGHGYFDELKIGGSSDDVVLNEVGPEIQLFLNDESFVEGGITNEVPILIAKLSDENGINTAGNGIGHDLKVVIDENTSQAIILNNNYEADTDSYQSGTVRYQLEDLSPGTHVLTMKAWDTHNNSSEESIEFTVVEEAELALEQVFNYPNPFTTSTEFMFEHNAACNVLDVQVQVFTVGGNLVKTINQRIESSGYRASGIMWNGRDDYGDELARGVYVYKVKIRTPEGRKAEEFQKLVMLK